MSKFSRESIMTDLSDSDSEDDAILYQSAHLSKTPLAGTYTKASSSQVLSKTSIIPPLHVMASASYQSLRSSTTNVISTKKVNSLKDWQKQAKKEEKEEQEQKKAVKQKVIKDLAFVQEISDRITSRDVLKWQCVKERRHMCRICDAAEGFGLFKCSPGYYDEKDYVLVQFIRVPMGRMQVVKRTSLISYRAKNDPIDQWDPVLIKTPTAKKFKVYAERVLAYAKKIEQETLDDEQDAEETLKLFEKEYALRLVEEELEESKRESIHSDVKEDSAEKIANDKKRALEIMLGPKKKTEPINPGDVIIYYSPIYAYGNEDGFRETVVLAVDPSNEYPLLLTNSEYIEQDTIIKRINTWDKKRGEHTEYEGIERRIEHYKLTLQPRNEKLEEKYQDVFKTKATDVREVLTKYVTKLVEEEGTGIEDFLNKDLVKLMKDDNKKSKKNSASSSALVKSNPNKPSF